MEFSALKTNFENRLPFKFSLNNYYSREMKLLEQKKKKFVRRQPPSFPVPQSPPHPGGSHCRQFFCTLPVRVFNLYIIT